MTKVKSFRKILAIVLSVILAFAMMATFVSCKEIETPPEVTKPKNIDKDPVGSLEPIKAGDKIYHLSTNDTLSVVKPNAVLQPEELIMATSIQGLLARESARIFIGTNEDPWIDFIKVEYDLEFEKFESLESFIKFFSDNYSKDKSYVKFKYEKESGSTTINQATTIASAEGCIMLPVTVSGTAASTKLIELVESLGFTSKRDLIADATIPSEKELFDTYKDALNKQIIGVTEPQMRSSYGLRDYIIAQNAGCYISSAQDPASVAEFNDLYQEFDPLSIAIGNSFYKAVIQNQDKGFKNSEWADKAAADGIIPVLATASLSNLSLFASLSKEVGKQKATVNDEIPESGVHYVSVVANFGNDLSFWSDAFTSTKKFLSADYSGKYPVGITMNSMLYELMPNAIKDAYSNNMTGKEMFIASPSGFGLANLSTLASYKEDVFNKYLERSNEIFGKADLGYVSVFGNINNDTAVLDKVAGLSNVKGGFILAEEYTTPTGGVYESNGKYFIASREILRDAKHRTNEQIANDSNEKMLARLETYSKDKSSVDAYTLIQVDNTLTSVNSFEKICKQVFEKTGETICYVTPDKLVEMIKDNVTDKKAGQTVGSLNKAPTAENFTVEAAAGESIEIIMNSVKDGVILEASRVNDPNPEDRSSLVVKAGKRPSNGKITIGTKSVADGDSKIINTVITFKPDETFTSGTDSFEYTVSDGNETAKGVVTVVYK